MFGFLKKSEKEKLKAKYEKLIKEAYKLSHVDRKASDLKMAEAQEVLDQMEVLN